MGVGKEKLAQAFQQKGKPYYAINCASFAEEGEQFAESQLFGQVKGAYTGATQEQKGAFEHANGGVIFLDEIHHLSLATQAKLLRVLQENKFRRLGESTTEERKFEATVIAATKPVIFEMIKQGTFLSDLYYKLKVKEIKVPDLKDRPADIRPLTDFFVRKFSDKFKKEVTFSSSLMRSLEAHSWPGNVRELENFVESTIMTCNLGTIGSDIFKLYLDSEHNFSNESVSDEQNIDLEQQIDTVKTAKIIEALKLSEFVEEAARRLNMKRSSLYGWMKKFDIEPKRYLNKYSEQKGEL